MRRNIMLECAVILVIRYTVHFNIFKIPTIELTDSEVHKHAPALSIEFDRKLSKSYKLAAL